MSVSLDVSEVLDSHAVTVTSSGSSSVSTNSAFQVLCSDMSYALVSPPELVELHDVLSE